MGVVYTDIYISRHLKEELAYAIDKWFRFINKAILIQLYHQETNEDMKCHSKLETIVYALLYGPSNHGICNCGNQFLFC